MSHRGKSPSGSPTSGYNLKGEPMIFIPAGVDKSEMGPKDMRNVGLNGKHRRFFINVKPQSLREKDSNNLHH